MIKKVIVAIDQPTATAQRFWRAGYAAAGLAGFLLVGMSVGSPLAGLGAGVAALGLTKWNQMAQRQPEPNAA